MNRRAREKRRQEKVAYMEMLRKAQDDERLAARSVEPEEKTSPKEGKPVKKKTTKKTTTKKSTSTTKRGRPPKKGDK